MPSIFICRYSTFAVGLSKNFMSVCLGKGDLPPNSMGKKKCRNPTRAQPEQHETGAGQQSFHTMWRERSNRESSHIVVPKNLFAASATRALRSRENLKSRRANERSDEMNRLLQGLNQRIQTWWTASPSPENESYYRHRKQYENQCCRCFQAATYAAEEKQQRYCSREAGKSWRPDLSEVGRCQGTARSGVHEDEHLFGIGKMSQRT